MPLLSNCKTDRFDKKKLTKNHTKIYYKTYIYIQFIFILKRFKSFDYRNYISFLWNSTHLSALCNYYATYYGRPRSRASPQPYLAETVTRTRSVREPREWRPQIDGGSWPIRGRTLLPVIVATRPRGIHTTCGRLCCEGVSGRGVVPLAVWLNKKTPFLVTWGLLWLSTPLRRVTFSVGEGVWWLNRSSRKLMCTHAHERCMRLLPPFRAVTTVVSPTIAYASPPPQKKIVCFHHRFLIFFFLFIHSSLSEYTLCGQFTQIITKKITLRWGRWNHVS